MENTEPHGTFAAISDALALAIMNGIAIASGQRNPEELTLVTRELSHAIEDVVATIIIGLPMQYQAPEPEVPCAYIFNFWEQRPGFLRPDELETCRIEMDDANDARIAFASRYVDTMEKRYVIDSIYPEWPALKEETECEK